MDINNKVPQQNDQYRLEEMDNEHLLYNPLQTKTIYLNSSATLIWRLCDGEITIGQIMDLLTEAFPDSEQQIRSDVISSIDELVSNQVIFLN